MELHESARKLIGKGADATLVTLNPDGSPHVSLVWVAWRSTPDGDELVAAHLSANRKVRNIRRDPRVAVTIVSPSGPERPFSTWLSINGTGRIVEGGAPELLKELSETMTPGVEFVTEGASPGFRTRIHIDTVGGVGPWAT